MIITAQSTSPTLPSVPDVDLDSLLVVARLGSIVIDGSDRVDEYGTAWHLGAHPWSTTASMRAASTDLLGDDGGADATRFFEPWQYELTGVAVGTPLGLRQSEALLKQTLGRTGTTLRVTEPGNDRWQHVRRDGGLAWPLVSGVPSDQMAVRFQIPLLAPDPRLYSTTPRTLEAPLPGAGSPPVPHEVPHAVSSGAVVRSATNAGTETAWPVWRLVGPWENLRLSNPGTGEFMEFRMSLGAGEWLQVTTAPRGSGRGTVLLMGDRDLSRRRQMVGGYWGFGPGETQVIVTGTSPLAGVNQVFATHNDVWV